MTAGTSDSVIAEVSQEENLSAGPSNDVFSRGELWRSFSLPVSIDLVCLCETGEILDLWQSSFGFSSGREPREYELVPVTPALESLRRSRDLTDCVDRRRLPFFRLLYLRWSGSFWFGFGGQPHSIDRLNICFVLPDTCSMYPQLRMYVWSECCVWFHPPNPFYRCFIQPWLFFKTKLRWLYLIA